MMGVFWIFSAPLVFWLSSSFVPHVALFPSRENVPLHVLALHFTPPLCVIRVSVTEWNLKAV